MGTMSWRIRIDPADTLFSAYIRRRDKRCVRCGKVGAGPKGIDGLQCSHYFGRRKESTRFSPQNTDALCCGCHQHWGSTDREAYRAFKVKQLGKLGFDRLTLLANTYAKRDRKMALIVAKALLASLDKLPRIINI